MLEKGIYETRDLNMFMTVYLPCTYLKEWTFFFYLYYVL